VKERPDKSGEWYPIIQKCHYSNLTYQQVWFKKDNKNSFAYGVRRHIICWLCHGVLYYQNVLYGFTYTRKCNYIYDHKKSSQYRAHILTEVRDARQQYQQIYRTEFHTYLRNKCGKTWAEIHLSPKK